MLGQLDLTNGGMFAHDLWRHALVTSSYSFCFWGQQHSGISYRINKQWAVGMWKWKLLSHVQFFATPRTVAHQAPLNQGILQARILEWVAVPFSTWSSQPRHWTQVSHIAGGFFTKLQLGNLSLLQGIFLTQGLIGVSWTAGGFFTSWGTRETLWKPRNLHFVTPTLRIRSRG